MNREDLINSILSQAVNESNRQLPAERALNTQDDCPIAAQGGSLDSLGLITFLAALESAASKSGHRVDLLNEDSLTSKEEFFANVATVKQTLARQL